MAELQKLADLQDNACDPRTDETCDLSEIIEAIKGLSDIEDPFAELRDINKAQIILANVLVTSIPLLQIIIPLIIYYAKVNKNLDAQGARGTNYQYAWLTMLVGHALAYTPTVLMWGPSYTAEKWLLYYQKTTIYAKKMHLYMGIAVLTFLVTDLILTTAPGDQEREKNDWTMMMVYCEMQLLIWWGVPHFKLDQGAQLLYMWEFITQNKEKFDDAVTMNDGDANEIPNDVTELHADFFDI